jgi:hypothetical protein
MKKLFCAHMIHLFELRAGKQLEWPVLENIVLVVAASGAAAIRSAMRIGARLDHVDDESMRWKGLPVRERFRGLRKIVNCDWDLPRELLGARKRAARPSRLDDLHGVEASYSFFFVRGRRNLDAYLRGAEVELTYEA